MSNSKHTLLNRLQHHVTGAIERGEKTAIEAVVKAKYTPGLIAAAPEMLEALEKMIGAYDVGQECGPRVRANWRHWFCKTRYR